MPERCARTTVSRTFELFPRGARLVLSRVQGILANASSVGWRMLHGSTKVTISR
jgi:hypothetical protein